MPPPAEALASRLIVGPTLRAQPDRRLVALVRGGYEVAFEEIVRRYAKPLRRYATSIVGGRSEDVTQDAFSKALVALRRDGGEIELRPWLYRIVRNTALNELRDRPPTPEALAEAAATGGSPAEELERREEIADLMKRLRALPESQRAAIVMRELEGLGHDEIAAALGLSDGAARQAIYRARQALRNGVGLLVPMPLLRALLEHADDATAAGGAIAAGAGTSSAGGAALGGLGGGAVKVGLTTVLVAGAVGAGVAVEQRAGNGGPPRAAEAAPLSDDGSATSSRTEDAPSDGSEGGDRGGRTDDPSRGERAGEDHGGLEGRAREGSDGHSGDSGEEPRHSGREDGAGSDRHQEGGNDADGHSGPGSSSDDGGDDSSGPSGSSGDDGGVEIGSDSGDSSGPGGGDFAPQDESDPLVEESSNSGTGSATSGGSDSDNLSGESSGSGSSGTP